MENHDRTRTKGSGVFVFGGRLTPNSELLVEAGIEVRPLTDIPYIKRGGQLAAPGCFVAGNAVGGFHGG